jgi:hypothetical protein
VNHAVFVSLAPTEDAFLLFVGRFPSALSFFWKFKPVADAFGEENL